MADVAALEAEVKEFKLQVCHIVIYCATVLNLTCFLSIRA
jgi:hypothetical protein